MIVTITAVGLMLVLSDSLLQSEQLVNRRDTALDRRDAMYTVLRAAARQRLEMLEEQAGPDARQNPSVGETSADGVDTDVSDVSTGLNPLWCEVPYLRKFSTLAAERDDPNGAAVAATRLASMRSHPTAGSVPERGSDDVQGNEERLSEVLTSEDEIGVFSRYAPFHPLIDDAAAFRTILGDARGATLHEPFPSVNVNFASGELLTLIASDPAFSVPSPAALVHAIIAARRSEAITDRALQRIIFESAPSSRGLTRVLGTRTLTWRIQVSTPAETLIWIATREADNDTTAARTRLQVREVRVSGQHHVESGRS